MLDFHIDLCVPFSVIANPKAFTFHGFYIFISDYDDS